MAARLAPQPALEHLPLASACPIENALGALAGLQSALLQLTAAAEQKLRHLRQADANALLAVAAGEQNLLRIVRDSQKALQAAFARAAQAVPPPAPRPAGWSELARALPEPDGARILARVEGLRAAAEKLEKTNRCAARVAQALHRHVRAVVSELARPERAAAAYGGNGQRAADRPLPWMEAVG